MLALWTFRTLWHLSGPKQVSTKKELEKKNNVLTAGKVRFDIWTCQGLSLPRPVWLVCTKQLNFGSTPQVLTNISLVQVGILIKQIKRQWFSYKRSVPNSFVVLSVGKCYWTMSREKKPRNPSEPHFCHFCLPLFVQILAAPPLLLSQVGGWRHGEMEKENTFLDLEILRSRAWKWFSWKWGVVMRRRYYSSIKGLEILHVWWMKVRMVGLRCMMYEWMLGLWGGCGEGCRGGWGLIRD